MCRILIKHHLDNLVLVKRHDVVENKRELVSIGILDHVFDHSRTVLLEAHMEQVGQVLPDDGVDDQGGFVFHEGYHHEVAPAVRGQARHVAHD